MPGPQTPESRDHFVYVFHANGYPFYVGHGHAGRLSDRPIYIDRLVRLHPDRTYYKWKLHGLVIAELWESKTEVLFDQISAGQTKAEAAAQELALMRELLSAGFLLSNSSGNPRVRPAAEIAAAVRSGAMMWDRLIELKPINRYVRPL